MNPIDIPPRSILLRENIRQIQFNPPPPKEDGTAAKGIEKCGTLQVLAELPDEENELPRLHSYWVPSEEEMASLKAGEPIRLTVWGAGLQPMAVGVGY